MNKGQISRVNVPIKKRERNINRNILMTNKEMLVETYPLVEKVSIKKCTY